MNNEVWPQLPYLISTNNKEVSDMFHSYYLTGIFDTVLNEDLWHNVYFALLDSQFR
jgi:hypothetical protein